jgi:molybdopterin molybdotransferase
LKVLLISTGDEITSPGSALEAGKIFDGNTTLLQSAMHQAGLDVIPCGKTSDDKDELTKVIRENCASVDLIVTTGGVSMGAYEVVRQAAADQDIEFIQVAMQPGGPQAIGKFDGVPFLGFPGNPVSCLISFEMFLRPALTAVFGAPVLRLPLSVPLIESLDSPIDKYQLRRGTLLQDGTVKPEGGAGSHLLHSLAKSNVLIHLPVGTASVVKGQNVKVTAL